VYELITRKSQITTEKTDIGNSDPSQNYEKMCTEFILPLLFDENIDILLCKNSEGSLSDFKKSLR
jgi:hypothetical protein